LEFRLFQRGEPLQSSKEKAGSAMEQFRIDTNLLSKGASLTDESCFTTKEESW
jgi:hypothetical protein